MNQQFPTAFHVNFWPAHGVWFDFQGLRSTLLSGIGHFDGESVSQTIEAFWSSVFRDRNEIPVFRLSADGTNWTKTETQKVSILWLLRSGPFGILCPLPTERDDARPHLFLEFNPPDDSRSQYSCVCHFSIKDENAAMLPSVEHGKSKTQSFSELLRAMTFMDGTPLADDPGMIFRAIGRICRPKNDVDLAHSLLNAHGENTVSGEDFLCVETGLVLKSDMEDIGANQGSPIFLLLTKGQEPYFFFDRGFKIGVPCRECLPPLERYVEIDNASLSTLASKAEAEDWSFVNGSGQIVPFGRLRYYLQFIFEKIEQDHETGKDFYAPEVVQYSDGVSEVFCTGLLDRDSGLYIYAFCSDPDPVSGVYRHVEWVSKNRDSSGNYLPHPILDNLNSGTQNHGLPYPVNWTDDPSKLIIQYSRLSFSNVEFNFQHIVFDNWKRIRTVFPEWNHSDFPPQDAYSAFINLLENHVWSRTRKLIAANYKVAIPVWYRGSIQLLLPLFLDVDNPTEPTVALVLAKNLNPGSKREYYAPTCLTLDMAKNNARVIARVDETWLGENSTPLTKEWLLTEIQRETDLERRALLGKLLTDLNELHTFDSKRKV